MKILKYFTFALFAMALSAGCGGVGEDDEFPDKNPGGDKGDNVEDPSGDGTGLVATVSPSVIVANGIDKAIIEVRFDGQPLSIGDVTFYNDADNTPLGWTSFEYTADAPGTVSFWVSYKTHNTKNKPLTITAEMIAPEKGEDPKPGSTSFVHRNLLIDFTGTWCGYCPYMAAAMHNLEADPDYSPLMVMAAVHNGDTMTPDDKNIDSSLGISGYPTMVIDFRRAFSNSGSVDGNVRLIKSLVDDYQKEPAKAGIAASVVCSGNTVAVLASVKAAENGEYRLGGWLLEDGIYGRQSIYGNIVGDYDFNTHNHVVRIPDSRYSSNNYLGHDLGKIEAGKSTDYLFTWQLKDSWVKENCSVVLFVTTTDDRGYLYLTNAVHLDSINGVFPFEYAE